MNPPLADRKNVLLAIAVALSAMLLSWPFADMPYGDDFAYAHVALKLSQTGHIIYNGWEFAMLFAHAYWGTLFIRLFGFSFQCLRFSTIPFSIGAVVLAYLLVRRAGLNHSFALLTTLIIALSPVFLLLSVTYMTDIPALFFTLASLYALVRANELSDNLRGYLWLFLGAVTGLVGGTGRQGVWLVPLAVLPYLAFVKRSERRFALTSFGVWTITAAGVAIASSWLNRQLYIGTQLSVIHQLKLVAKHPFSELNILSRVTVMLLFLVLPAAIPLAATAVLKARRGPGYRKLIIGLPVLSVIAAVLIHPSLASIPWLPSTFNWEGINGTGPLPGRPVILVYPIRALVALTVYLTACALAGQIVEIRRLGRRALEFLLHPSPEQFTLGAMTVFSAVYSVLLVLRGIEIDIFDRYLLPLMPGAAALLMIRSQSHQPRGRKRVRAISVAWIILAVIGLYGIASTQDLWSLARARITATRKLETAGIPRASISAGMEYDGWTQLLINGHVNDPWVRNPPTAFRRGFGMTPDVVPIYILEYKPSRDTELTQFGVVPYFSALPPFRSQVSIDRILPGHSAPDATVWRDPYP